MMIELFTLLLKTLFQENHMFRSFTSSLYDQTTFCDKFDKDTSQAKERNIRIIINTKPFEEHEAHY